jgi:hypothetical protein
MRLYALTNDTHGPDFSQNADCVKALALTIPNGTNDTRTMEICNAKQISQ